MKLMEKAETHSQRVARHAATIAAGRRLFEAGGYDHRSYCRRVRCIGCDAVCPPYGLKGPPAGWESRRAMLMCVIVVELNCPQCLRAWGFGEMYADPAEV